MYPEIGKVHWLSPVRARNTNHKTPTNTKPHRQPWRGFYLQHIKHYTKDLNAKDLPFFGNHTRKDIIPLGAEQSHHPHKALALKKLQKHVKKLPKTPEQVSKSQLGTKDSKTDFCAHIYIKNPNWEQKVAGKNTITVSAQKTTKSVQKGKRIGQIKGDNPFSP